VGEKKKLELTPFTTIEKLNHGGPFAFTLAVFATVTAIQVMVNRGLTEADIVT
jgi:hypothetical protein